MSVRTDRLEPVLDWLACPACQRRGREEALSLDGSSVVCRQGHRIDVARDGHLTLISTPAGANADSSAMLEARSRVLAAGLLDGVDEVLTRRTAHATRILEAGAGTGHHLAAVLSAHDAASHPAHGLATDISPAAVRRAARAHERMAAVVADTWQRLPVRSHRVDAVLCVFAPRNRDEFARVLVEGGHLVVATPLPDHLVELREATGMIGIQPDKQSNLLASMVGPFEPVSRDAVRDRVRLGPDLAADVVAMGPSAHHDTRVADGLEVTVAVEVTTFTRRPSA